MGVLRVRELRRGGVGQTDLTYARPDASSAFTTAQFELPDFLDSRGVVAARYADPSEVEQQLSTAFVQGSFQAPDWWGALPSIKSLPLLDAYAQPGVLQQYGLNMQALARAWQQSITQGMAPWAGVRASASMPFMFGLGSLADYAPTTPLGWAAAAAVALVVVRRYAKPRKRRRKIRLKRSR